MLWIMEVPGPCWFQESSFERRVGHGGRNRDNNSFQATAFMASQPNQALPNGYRLNEYTIVRKIGGGGFSMVYLATDDHNNLFAIKEYLPGALVLRTAGSVVVEANSRKTATSSATA